MTCPYRPTEMWCEVHKRHWSYCLEEERDAALLQVRELQEILYRARWHVSTDNFCDCHARHGEPHKSENCLLLALAAAVEKSAKCCPPFEPDKNVHSEFCRNYTKKR